MRRIAALGVLLVVLACGGPPASAARRHASSCARVEGSRARRLVDEERRLTALLPSRWRCRGAVAFSADIAFADFPIPAFRPGERCPADGLRAPAGRALLYVLEFGDWRHARPAPPERAFARRRPTGRSALHAPLVRTGCFGGSRRVRWREGGRRFEAHLYLGPGAPRRRRRELARVMDSLTYHAGCRLRCTALRQRRTSVTFRDGAHGLKVRYPIRWRRAHRNLAPAVADPRQLLALSSGRPAPCALRSSDVSLTLSERRYTKAYSTPRPSGFARARRGEPPVCHGGGERPDARVLSFSDQGRSFQLVALVGADAPARRRAALARVLRSLRFREPVLVDRVGFTAVLPAGWDLRANTAFDGDASFGSFPLAGGRPDASSCRPAWVRQRSPRDAALYVVEYGHGPVLPSSSRARRRAFPRGRPLARDALREPVRRYECPGRSRLVRWRERGRYLQAHLFLGRRADPGRRRELAALFDSLRFRR